MTRFLLFDCELSVNEHCECCSKQSKDGERQCQWRYCPQHQWTQIHFFFFILMNQWKFDDDDFFGKCRVQYCCQLPFKVIVVCVNCASCTAHETRSGKRISQISSSRFKRFCLLDFHSCTICFLSCFSFFWTELVKSVIYVFFPYPVWVVCRLISRLVILYRSRQVHDDTYRFNEWMNELPI